ncbi:multidrug resistance protein [Polymorphobacter multimanifer]|uniref:MFS transporter n=1 Tax=Polymorphobacter multimanifer TaxID=1070431 RepID=UPI00166DAA79|nr:MFS transporter [Polymorphobacter multimanifer]GGI90974.1 multidrug resistance protein [Polymorphobacter multimanifer]
MPAAPTRNAIPSREFAVLFAALLLVAAGNTAMQTVLPGIARVIGIPDLAVALIFSLSALLWTFSAPYWARQSDIRGRRKLIMVGVIGFGVSMLGCAIIIHAGLIGLIAPLVTFGLFAGMRALFGIFGSASNPASQAYVAGRTSEADRTSALSILASAFGLGTIIGPAIAPLFVFGTLGLAGPMFAFAAMAIVVLVAVARVLPDDDPTQFIANPAAGTPSSEPLVSGGASGASLAAATAGRGTRLAWRDARILPFMVFGFASGSVQAATGQAMGFLIIDRLGGNALEAQGNIAIAFMAGAGATLLAQWGIIPRLQLQPPALMRWGTIIAAIGTAGIAMAPSFHALVVAFAFATLGYGLARPGFTAGASLAVGRAEQGGAAGVITAVNGACYIAGPAIGIGLYTFIPELPYWLGAVALLLLRGYTLATPILRQSLQRPDEPS